MLVFKVGVDMDNKRQICSVIGLLFFVILSFIVGFSTHRIDIVENLDIYLDGEKQYIRDKNGRLLNAIEKKDTLYLPVNELGYYLDYMTVTEENKVYLYELERGVNTKKLEGFKTETYDGEVIDSSVFGKSDYTLMLLWSTDCDKCKEKIVDLASLNDYFSGNNIQVMSVVTNQKLLAFDGRLEESEIDNIKTLSQSLGIDYYLYQDSIIRSELIGKSISVPKIFIFDSEGNLVKIVDKNINSQSIKTIFDFILGK